MHSKYFAPWELLPHCPKETTWETLPVDLAALLDPDLLVLVDKARDLLGPIIINNYHNGGTRRWCGFRDPRCKEYTPGSMHSKGKAFDGHPVKMSAEAARAIIKGAVAKGLLPELGGVELDVSWLHLDTRPHTPGKPLYFRPK